MAVTLLLSISREALALLEEAARAGGHAAPGHNVTPPARLELDVSYREAVRQNEHVTEEVARTERVELSGDRKRALEIGPIVGSVLTVDILSTEGSATSSRVVLVEGEHAEYLVTAPDIERLLASRGERPEATTPVFVRQGQLMPIGAVAPKFAGSRFSVAAVASGADLDAGGGIGDLRFDVASMASLEVHAAMFGALASIAWTPLHIAVDGSFAAQFAQQQGVGWIWWLSGDRQIVGFVPDDLTKPARTKTAIPLPALAAPEPDDEGPPQRADCGRSVPADATEAELADNPGVYSEDPGAFCKPFSNPERVLSEKSFSVIARIQTPDIGAIGSGRSKLQHLLNLDALATLGERPMGTDRIAAAANLDLIASAVLNANPTRVVEPPEVVAEYDKLPSGRTHVSARSPIQWEDNIAQYQAATVALGHVLDFRVRCRSNGYSLGNVASTLTLAPRQTKRIQKIEFERVERARRQETTQLADTVSDDLVRERDYDDSVSASLKEWARGKSSSTSAGIAGGIGFFTEKVLGAIGGGAGTARSSSSQDGGRETAAREHQRLRDAIRRHGDAVRRFDSTVVSEVSQEETVTGTTEIIRNPNYGHSITVIYYQILRHLKVSTELAGVRECLFVPFSVKPFTLQRAYRWRESIQKYIRSPLFARALLHLRDVVTAFAFSGLHVGTRAQQPLSFLRGSIYLTLAVERPSDGAGGIFDVASWALLSPFLGTPARGIWERLRAASEAARDQAFQKEHAPTIASKWVNKIVVKVGNVDLQADVTLATRYGFNQTVRVDFTVRAAKLAGLTRERLATAQVVGGASLPPGSVANVTRVVMHYGAAGFERTIDGLAGVGDLVTPETGAVDPGAQADFPLTAWDHVNEREQLRQSVNELIEHLNEHVEYYHKAILWSMDRDRLLMLLDGFYVPGTNNVSIASVVDREPLAIIGNSMVYGVGAATYIGYGSIKTPTDLRNLYTEKQPIVDPLLLSLPTDGLYAQTIMDPCLALEEHKGSIDWVLDDPDPELGVIHPSLLASRASTAAASTVTPTTLPATIINLMNAPDAPAPAGLQDVLRSVTNPNAFRDMAGLTGTQSNAAAALTNAANLATSFGNHAASLKLADTAAKAKATEDANQQLATVNKAKSEALISGEDATDHANKILNQLHSAEPQPPTPLNEDPAVQQAMRSAAKFDATRSDATGQQSVSFTRVNLEEEAEDLIFPVEVELSQCDNDIIALVEASPLVNFDWPDRGRAPIGYLKGMGLTYARVYCKWRALDPFVISMARAMTNNGQIDALRHYRARFEAVGMNNDQDGADTLRHLFVLLVGLGMRESSGDYCEGRDMSANNVSPQTAEAGLFQMSLSIGVNSANAAFRPLRDLYDELRPIPYTGYRSVFEEGVACDAGQLAGFGDTVGGRFRHFCVMYPALSAEIAALGLRIRRRHWGPINVRTVTLNTDCDALLSSIQQAIDNGNCCSHFAPTHVIDV